VTSSLAAPADSELLIKGSRFLGRVQPVADRDAARALVQALREEHPGAAHVCSAMLVGGHSAAVDDGEPGGTAGRPMLEVLRLQQLDGVLATVVRYFGGTKLGAGGLVRAYSGAVADALRSAERVPVVERTSGALRMPYALEGAVRRSIEGAGATLEEVDHAESVTVRYAVDATSAAALAAALDELGQGRIDWLAE
jgi:uncharacterized YigZ family protein